MSFTIFIKFFYDEKKGYFLWQNVLLNDDLVKKQEFSLFSISA